jgi:phage tail-like protein
MTQAISHEKLLISLTSMQPSVEASSNSLTLKDSKNNEPINNELLLIPGEVGELLLRIKNVANRPIRWQLRIVGDFPDSWCAWHQPEFTEIAPNQKIETAIAFKATNDFFENQLILNPENPLLKINYTIQIYIYIDEGTEPQLIQYRIFNLLVRPHTTYLDFLPRMYGEVDFIGRFVTILEQAFDPAVQTLDTLWAYLDPLTAPTAFLPFLAYWVGWEMDNRWDIERQRHLIRNAIILYRWHGTRYGLRLYLHLYTGLPLEQIQIREIFEQGFVLGSTHIGEDSMLGGSRPYHFIVDLDVEPSNHIDEELVRGIIERQKPAFCSYDLEIRNL